MENHIYFYGKSKINTIRRFFITWYECDYSNPILSKSAPPGPWVSAGQKEVTCVGELEAWRGSGLSAGNAGKL